MNIYSNRGKMKNYIFFTMFILIFNYTYKYVRWRLSSNYQKTENIFQDNMEDEVKIIDQVNLSKHIQNVCKTYPEVGDQLL